VPDEIDVAEAELLRQGGCKLRLEQPAARQQRLAEPHPADAGRLECGVELVVRKPALLEQDRSEHRPDLVLEVAVVEPGGRSRFACQPQAAADEPLIGPAAHVPASSARACGTMIPRRADDLTAPKRLR